MTWRDRVADLAATADTRLAEFLVGAQMLVLGLAYLTGASIFGAVDGLGLSGWMLLAFSVPLTVAAAADFLLVRHWSACLGVFSAITNLARGVRGEEPMAILYFLGLALTCAFLWARTSGEVALYRRRWRDRQLAPWKVSQEKLGT